jgi:ABC-type glycerol-3-phosphate transport system substrate-binding protein
MKKLIALALVLVLALSLLAACGGSSNSGGSTAAPPATDAGTSTPPAPQGGNDNTAKEWPDNKYTEGLPKPSGEILDVAVADKYGYTTVDMKWTKEEAQACGEALTAAGVPGIGQMGETQYVFNRNMGSDADPYFNGYLVEIKPYDDCYRVSIATPDE